MNDSFNNNAGAEQRSVFQQTQRELADIKYALDCSAIVAVTDGNGLITYANDRFCEISGYSREELLGQDHRIVNSGYHPKSFIRDLWRTILAGKVWRGEICNRRKDGENYWVDTTVVPFMDETRRPYQFISIRYETTERKRMEAALHNLPNRIIEAQESEREWISREIHDDLGQSLATLKILLQSARDRLDSKDQDVLAKPLSYMSTVIAKTRNLAAGLRPPTLELLGLTRAIRSLADDVQSQQSLQIDLVMDSVDECHFAGPAVHVYRIVQEALTNIIRHAGADRVTIQFEPAGRCLTVSITDNGCGFSADQMAAAMGGLGMTSMQERAKLLNGDIYLESSPGQGTTLTLTVPLCAAEI